MQSSAIEPLVRAAPYRTAPSLDVAAGWGELKDGRRRYVSILRGVAFFERMRPMEHPDIATGIRGCSADTTEKHMIRHDGEMGIHFEYRQKRTLPLILCDGGSPTKQSAKTAKRESRYASDALSIHNTVPPSTRASDLQIVHRGKWFRQLDRVPGLHWQDRIHSGQSPKTCKSVRFSQWCLPESNSDFSSLLTAHGTVQHFLHPPKEGFVVEMLNIGPRSLLTKTRE